MTKRCETCQNFWAISRAVGECRECPPYRNMEFGVAEWPIVSILDGCGYWEKRVTEATRVPPRPILKRGGF